MRRMHSMSRRESCYTAFHIPSDVILIKLNIYREEGREERSTHTLLLWSTSPSVGYLDRLYYCSILLSNLLMQSYHSMLNIHLLQLYWYLSGSRIYVTIYLFSLFYWISRLIPSELVRNDYTCLLAWHLILTLPSSRRAHIVKTHWTFLLRTFMFKILTPVIKITITTFLNFFS